MEKLIGHIDFYSATYRLWKLPLEPACEDYGQVAVIHSDVVIMRFRQLFTRGRLNFINMLFHWINIILLLLAKYTHD